MVYHLLDTRQSGLFDGADGGLDGLAQHQNPGFPGIGPRPIVAEALLLDVFRAVALSHGPLVEIFYPGGAMVHGYEVGHVRRQAIFLRQPQPFFYVAFNHFGAQMGRQGIVGVFLVELVLDKVLRASQFTDIVIIGSHPRQQAVGADGIGGSFHQIAHYDAVAEGTVGFPAEPAQHGMVEIGQLQQGQVGGDTEDDLQYSDQAVDHDGRQQPVDGGEHEVIAQGSYIGVLQELDGGDGQRIGGEDIDYGGEYLAATPKLPYGVDGHTARQQAGHYKVHLIAHHEAQHQGQGHSSDHAGASVEQDGEGHGGHCEWDQVLGQSETVMKQVAHSHDQHEQQRSQHYEAGLLEPGPAVYIQPGIKESHQKSGDHDHPDARQPQLDAAGRSDQPRFSGGQGTYLLQHLIGHPGVGIDDLFIFQHDPLGNRYPVHRSLLTPLGDLGIVDQV